MLYLASFPKIFCPNIMCMYAQKLYLEGYQYLFCKFILFSMEYKAYIVSLLKKDNKKLFSSSSFVKIFPIRRVHYDIFKGRKVVFSSYSSTDMSVPLKC